MSSGCSKHGFYGSNCNISCPNNCRHRSCHIEIGTCFECEAGYKGAVCATGIFFSFLFGKKYIGTFINVLTDFLAAAKETAVLF